MKSSAAAFEPGDVLYGRLRPYLNKVVRPDFPGLCSAEFIVLPDCPHIRSSFLQYRLNATDFVGFASHLDEGDRPRVDFAQIGSFPIQLPPAPEQRRIVSKIEELFSDLDAGVAALERVKANLKRYRASVLKAAAEGRLTARWRKRHPATVPAAQFLKAILSERRTKWEARQLRKFDEAGRTPPKAWKEKYTPPEVLTDTPKLTLPGAWAWAVADQLCSAVTDGEHITPHRTETGVYLLSARNILDGRLRLDEVDFISPATHAILCRRLYIESGDVLMSCSGTVGRSCVTPAGLAFSLVRSVAVLKPVVPIGEYLSMAIRSSVVRQQVNQKKSQTAQANIFQGKIKRLAFPLPPQAEILEIVAEVDRRLSQADATEIQVAHALQRAGRLRQGILKRAFEGRLVQQDPSDEPAESLLLRVRGTTAAAASRGSTERRAPRKARSTRRSEAR
jgi:type I restriction enzyme S subunit